MNIYIYYKCKWKDIRRIQQRFGFPECVTVNGKTCSPVTKTVCGNSRL